MGRRFDAVGAADTPCDAGGEWTASPKEYGVGDNS